MSKNFDVRKKTQDAMERILSAKIGIGAYDDETLERIGVFLTGQGIPCVSPNTVANLMRFKTDIIKKRDEQDVSTADGVAMYALLDDIVVTFSQVCLVLTAHGTTTMGKIEQSIMKQVDDALRP